jgi:hypothetical protein
MKMQSKAALVALVGVSVVGGAVWTKVAQAGYKNDYDIDLNLDARYARGSLGTIRASANTKAYLSIELFGGTSVGWAEVWMRDAAGTTRTCRIGGDRQGMIATARSATGDSYVDVSWDAGGDCSSLMVENSSHLRPKTL